jgi:hypothetical protein
MLSRIGIGGIQRAGIRLTWALVAVVAVASFAGCPSPTVLDGIEGDWGGYWWYSGTEGDVYIAWSFYDGQFWCDIPSAEVSISGTYAIGANANGETIDLTVETSNTAAWVVGNTYRGYYSIEGDTMYRSQMFETRPTWTSSLLNPYASTVFVAQAEK